MRPLYESSRQFVLSDALVSHGELLLRADKIDGSKHNVDIIFFGTEYIQLPTCLYSIRLFQRIPDKPIGYERVDIALGRNTHHLFEIQSEAESYYIVATSFRVYENHLSFGETSLGVLRNKGRDKEIARSLYGN